MSRCGRAAEHCCWIAGEVCPHLQRSAVPGFRWACALRAALGSWAAVHAAPAYGAVRARLRAAGVAQDCGDWPPPGVSCHCGETG